MYLAAQLKRTKEGRIDISTPDSILTSIPLRVSIMKAVEAPEIPIYMYFFIIIILEIY